MVSTAVTTNMISTGTIALISNTGFTGRNAGIANQLDWATLFQFNTHDLVYSTPSAFTAVCGRTIAITAATIYPKIEEELKIPFPQCFITRITISTNVASAIFSMEPKSLAVLPPPKELIPTEIKDRPMERTTVPVTTDGKNFLKGFKNAPRTVSIRPPKIDAPIIAP